MKNFSENVRCKIKLLDDRLLAINEAEEILIDIFKESDVQIKSLVNEHFSKFFPTKKFSVGWDNSFPNGITHYISGGINLLNFLKWNSSFNYYSEGEKPNEIINSKSTAFIIDVNGDVYNLIDLTKNYCDIHEFTHRSLSITFINAGKLVKKDDKYYWHGGKKNNWNALYPYEDIAKPIKYDDEFYHQPINDVQLKSAVYLHRLLLSYFGKNVKNSYGNTIFGKIVDVFEFSKEVLDIKG